MSFGYLLEHRCTETRGLEISSIRVHINQLLAYARAYKYIRNSKRYLFWISISLLVLTARDGHKPHGRSQEGREEGASIHFLIIINHVYYSHLISFSFPFFKIPVEVECLFSHCLVLRSLSFLDFSFSVVWLQD